MRIELIKRPQQSTFYAILSPFLALGLTLIAGAIMFSLLGKNPLDALYYYFIVPLSGLWNVDDVWQLHELAIKAAPLIMIAVGLSVCYLSNNWNIGAEGQLDHGRASPARSFRWCFPGFESWIVLPLMLVLGVLGGAAYGAIPAFLKTRFNTNEILTSLMLVYVAQLFLDWVVRGPWRDPKGFNFPQTVQFNPSAVLPEIMPMSGRANWGFVFALVAAAGHVVPHFEDAEGFRGQGARPEPAGRAVRRLLLVAHGLLRLPGVGRACRPCRHLGSVGRDRPAAAGDLAGLRLHRDHRRLPRPAQSARHRRSPGWCWRCPISAARPRRSSIGVSDKAVRAFQGMLLFFVLACDTLILYRIRIVTWSAKAEGAVAWTCLKRSC